MVDLMAFSAREIGNRERQEDYAVHEYIKTPIGLHLYLAIACDGAGGGEVGEMAARLTARSIIDHIEISEQTNIPRLLIEAIESANELVYSELHGEGTSTVSMVAVDLNDSEAPNGRLYTASVGDSYTCLMREGQLIRLNIDHILANEYIYAGQMSVSEANHLANAEYPTRVIGVNPEIQVDIGFYAEKNNNFVNSRRAFNIGKVGMILQEGDTIFVSSDGIFRVGQGSRKPYVHKDELLRHAMDDDAERTVRTILRHASVRRPDDNLCVSMLMVPSRLRHPVHTTAEIPLQQRIALGGIAVALLIIAVLIFMTVANNSLPDTDASESSTVDAVIEEPTRAAINQIGVQFFSEPNLDNVLSVPLFEDRSFSYSDLNYLDIDGLNAEALPEGFLSAGVFMQAGSTSEITTVSNQAPENIHALLYPDSDLFINTGEFSSGGVRIEYQPDSRFVFNSKRTECVAVQHISALPDDSEDVDKLAFTCLTGDANSCNFRIPGRQPTQMVIGQQYVIDVNNQTLIETVAIDYDHLKTYYDTVVKLQRDDTSAICLATYLDVDGDGVRYPDDGCEFTAGLAGNQGCPSGASPDAETSKG
jgi:serine/threonine protein phosphatase PrpC